MVFMKEIFEKVDFEKNQQTTIKAIQNYPSCKELGDPNDVKQYLKLDKEEFIIIQELHKPFFFTQASMFHSC